jgi:glycolate oxidase FAD binding subunit
MPQTDRDCSTEIAAQVRDAAAARTPLAIVGGNSKPWLGRRVTGAPLTLAAHSGIVTYEPTELVLTARAGTPLAAIERLLADHGQMLAFEPPHLGTTATLGGTVACGLSGPARAARGAARDYVLGARVVNGAGEVLRFGGQVMKNVAGYDVSRLMVGAQGTLGVLLDVSLKVLPCPETSLTLVQTLDQAAAITAMNRIAMKPWPLSASAWLRSALYLRLSGDAAAVRAAAHALGGEPMAEAEAAAFWHALREREHALQTANLGESALWRLSVPSTCPPLQGGEDDLVEWGGALRWRVCADAAAHMQQIAQATGGHATAFRRGADALAHPLSPLHAGLHARLRAAFDPRRMLNPGRLYPDL